jgi:hypothetical protein
MSDRPFPEVVVRRNVACQSDRNHFGTVIDKPTLIVIHDTEGGNIPHSHRDLSGLADWFDRISTQASSNVADDQDGNSARFVDDDRKAWAQAFYNSHALSIEQIGFATDDWTNPAKDKQIRETARWIALWHRRYGIPLQKARISPDGRIITPGVIQHRALGHLGGDHHDVSSLYPGAKVLRYARHYVTLQNQHEKESK